MMGLGPGHSAVCAGRPSPVSIKAACHWHLVTFRMLLSEPLACLCHEDELAWGALDGILELGYAVKEFFDS